MISFDSIYLAGSPGFVIAPSSPTCPNNPGYSNNSTPGYQGGEIFFPSHITFNMPPTPVQGESRPHRPRRNSFVRPRR